MVLAGISKLGDRIEKSLDDKETILEKKWGNLDFHYNVGMLTYINMRLKKTICSAEKDLWVTVNH